MSRIPTITTGMRVLAINPAVWPRTNLWYNDETFEAYIRSTQHAIPMVNARLHTLDLANFTVTHPTYLRGGRMREMFEVAEDVVLNHPVAEAVFVESVLNEAIIPFLQARGYVLAAPPQIEGEPTNWFKLLVRL